MSIAWIIALAAYAVIMTALVFWAFTQPGMEVYREFWTILITWIISLVFGPVLLLLGAFGFFRALFKKK